MSTNPSDGRRRGGFQFRYGMLETRVYIPSAHGRVANWPAIMTLGQQWPQDGEGDLLEGLGGTVCFHWHSPINVRVGLGGCDKQLKPGWHTLDMDWEPTSVSWYYDGSRVGRIVTGITSAPMYIVIVNTASRLAWQVVRADTMRVAYVRVWQHA